MYQFRFLINSALLILLINLTAFGQSTSKTYPKIHFTVSMPQPHTHLLNVEMQLGWSTSGKLPSDINLIMPVWTPGSYLVREYARHVQDFRVEDMRGSLLKWKKINKHTWHVDTDGREQIKINYSVYANELTVRTNELNDEHAFWNNTALLMYVDGYLDVSSILKIVPPPNWEVATGLPSVKDSLNTFSANNFDELYDSPVEVGRLKTLSFNVSGIPHRIVIDGEGNYDLKQIERDIKKIAETTIELMGGDVPFKDYLFIIHSRADVRPGGLEHTNSTAINWPRNDFRPDINYRKFLAVVAHEYFHIWNVKGIRPDVLGPFNYTRENYTTLLWVAEGITEYYEKLLLRRAGIISDREYLDALSEAIEKLQNVPGRHEMSLEESSFDAWIKYYRPDENSINSQVSYYDKGGLVGMLIDLEIRKRSKGSKSLDDVMRYLNMEFFKKNRNYSAEDFQKAVELIAGSSMDTLFNKYVRGRDELDYRPAFEAVGLRLITSQNANSKGRAFLGVETSQEGDRLIITAIPAGTPAYEQGLNAKDQILALDGQRVTRTSLIERLKERVPGDTIKLTVFRFDQLRTFEIKLGAEPESGYRILPLPNSSDEQKRLYQGWIGNVR
jgi:predicted metalloprotease with PDZ domain